MLGWGGCALEGQYRVKTCQPWPDEWASGPRIPYDRMILFTAPTVEWHRKANWTSISTEITRMLLPRRDLYGFSRTGVAQPMTAGANEQALYYFEVKVGPCFFDFAQQPPRVAIDYQDKPFALAMADLMQRANRSYLISSDVGERKTVTARMTDVDWREAAVRVMLDANVFVEPVWYNPVSVRSYEYASQAEFLAAVRQAVDNMKNPTPDGPLTIVPWDQWVRHNRAYQVHYDLDLRSRSAVQQFGPPPGTAILSSDLAIAKKQVLYALPHQLKAQEYTTTAPAAGGKKP